MNPNQGKERVKSVEVVDAYWRGGVLYVSYRMAGVSDARVRNEQYLESDMWGNDSEPKGRG